MSNDHTATNCKLEILELESIIAENCVSAELRMFEMNSSAHDSEYEKPWLGGFFEFAGPPRTVVFITEYTRQS